MERNKSKIIYTHCKLLLGRYIFCWLSALHNAQPRANPFYDLVLTVNIPLDYHINTNHYVTYLYDLTARLYLFDR